MTSRGEQSDVDACLLGAALLAISPRALGGSVVRGASGHVREFWLAALADGLKPSRTVHVPLGVADENLYGGLDLSETLASGRAVGRAGLLTGDGETLVLMSMAEQWSPAASARVASRLDEFGVGGGWRCVLAFDESLADEAGPCAALTDRLGFRIDLAQARPENLVPPKDWIERIRCARTLLAGIDITDDLIEAMLSCSVSLGVRSCRADRFAVEVARAHAAWFGRSVVSEADAEVGIRLVLAPRATQNPTAEASSSEQQDKPESNNESPEPADAEPSSQPSPENVVPLEERLLAAVAACLPRGLLALDSAVANAQSAVKQAGRSTGAMARARRGRPIGQRRGDPRRDGAIHLLATIQAAAPWQEFRKRTRHGAAADAVTPRRVVILGSDLRVKRFKTHMSSTTVFAVDASGSSALHRMAEAKGAVELMLAECYVRRDQVALVAFRGSEAEVLLPPTRSLSRAKRALSELPGGGTTPLASGIDAAHRVSSAVRRAGTNCLLVLLTDGRANVALDGKVDRKAANLDARAAARRVNAEKIAALVIDTSPRPDPRAADLARDMAARYVPLPHADANAIFELVKAAGSASAG